MSSFRDHLLFALVVFLLLIAVGRLAVLNRDELRLISSARERETRVPNTGSFHGVGAGGSTVASDRNRPAGRLLFRLRVAHLEQDRHYWNEVIRHTDGLARRVHFWGVCDSGKACDAAQDESLFTVVGFLDPYQMRIVATATEDGSALLYNRNGILLDTLKPDESPAAAANQVIDQLRGLY